MESIIKVKVDTSFDRHESAPISVDTTTPRQLLDQFGVDYHVGQTNFNGIALGEENLDKPIRWFADNFEKINTATSFYMLNIPKQDNACRG